MPSTLPPPQDPLVVEAAERGFTPETLPALRQYLSAQASGRLDVAQRIGRNVRNFIRTNDPESGR